MGSVSGIVRCPITKLSPVVLSSPQEMHGEGRYASGLVLIASAILLVNLLDMHCIACDTLNVSSYEILKRSLILACEMTN